MKPHSETNIATTMRHVLLGRGGDGPGVGIGHPETEPSWLAARNTHQSRNQRKQTRMGTEGWLQYGGTGSKKNPLELSYELSSRMSGIHPGWGLSTLIKASGMKLFMNRQLISQRLCFCGHGSPAETKWNPLASLRWPQVVVVRQGAIFAKLEV